MAVDESKAEQGRVAAEGKGYRYCAVKAPTPVALAPGLTANRASAIIVLAKKWVNGTVLHYYFYTDPQLHGEMVNFADGSQEWRTYVGPNEQRDVVREAFTRWKGLGIGLEFSETADPGEAEIRIGFMEGDGSWSYVGTDILDHPSERTMNLGWDLARDPDTALHEIGHTLGLPHEHQNPNAGIVWKEEEVYRALAAPPNEWDRDKTFNNIIRKIAADTVQGSSWDPDSIMHYPFEAGLISRPEAYAGGLKPAGGLSARDVTWIRTFYPEIVEGAMRKLEPAVSQPLNVAIGQQADFLFTPEATRKFKAQSFGACDTQIVLFEDVDGGWRYLAADDDSGEDRNALVQVRLRQSRRYAVRVRLKHAGDGSPPSIMVW